MKDLHSSLKSEVLGKERSKDAIFSLAQLQWGKNDKGWSLHADPNSYSLSGFQVTDFLSVLGFEYSSCSFTDGRQCYVREVPETFDLKTFVARFDTAYDNLKEAQQHLEMCGYFFEQPEGWRYFGFGSSPRHRQGNDLGDGHTAHESKIMKNTEDASFRFLFSWLKNDERDKGWVVHCRPKDFPPSSEIESVFAFLKIEKFSGCPHFDFEPCYWHSIRFASRGDGFFDSNTEAAHGWFDAHAEHFSPGIEKLLTANAEIEKVGMRLLPFQQPSQTRLEQDIEARIVRSTSTPSKTASAGQNFDVVLSFAGTDRAHAEKLATLLEAAGYSVFYDNFYDAFLWGKDLAETFDAIFRKRARFCVIFVSNEYNNREWTIHERRSAQARAIKEKGKEYILPIKVDDVELPGLQPTIGYVPISKGIEKIGEMLVAKLKQ